MALVGQRAVIARPNASYGVGRSDDEPGIGPTCNDVTPSSWSGEPGMGVAAVDRRLGPPTGQ